jgi:hypothetical protein
MQSLIADVTEVVDVNHRRDCDTTNDHWVAVKSLGSAYQAYPSCPLPRYINNLHNLLLNFG